MMSVCRTRAARYALWVTVMLTLAALVLMGGCGGTKGPGLKYSFVAGEAFTYDLEVVMNGTVAAPGMTDDEGIIPKDATVKARFTMKVTDVKDGVATIVNTYESMEMIAEGQTETMPADELPSVTIKMDEYGKIISMDGATGGPLGGIMGDSGLPFDPAQLSGTALVGLPPSGKLTVGEEWTTTSEYPIPGLGQSVQATTKAKITALAKDGDNQLATIDFTFDIPMDLTIDLGALMGMLMEGAASEGLPDDLKLVMTMTGSQSYKGTSTVNLSKGLPAVLDTDGSLNIGIAITEAPEDMIPEDERGPFNIDITMKIKLAQVK